VLDYDNDGKHDMLGVVELPNGVDELAPGLRKLAATRDGGKLASLAHGSKSFPLSKPGAKPSAKGGRGALKLMAAEVAGSPACITRRRLPLSINGA